MSTPDPASPTLSPSLLTRLRRGGPPAFEIKFLVDDAAGVAIERWAQERLAADRYADPALGGAYVIRSLYLDTPEGDVYLRSARYRRRKYRVRRYGEADWVHVERKTKSGERVSKRRTAIAAVDVPRLGALPSDGAWAGSWFQERVGLKRLGPACIVSYRRHAFVGEKTDGPVRLTLDRGLVGGAWGQWSFPPGPGAGVPLLTGRVIIELKFLGAMPAVFKQVMQEFRLTPGSISKYRACREACGMVGGARALQQETSIA